VIFDISVASEFTTHHRFLIKVGLTPKMLKKPLHRRLYEYVVEEIGLGIIKGDYKPGDTLPNEDVLCKQFDVSRGALREATKLLAQKGLIRVRPKTGTVVQPSQEWNLFDAKILLWKLETGDRLDFLKKVTEVRRIIESQAVKFAAERAGEADITSIRACYHKMEQALKSEMDFNYEIYLQLDMAFHIQILNACHNELLAKIGHTMRQAVVAARKADIKDFEIHRDSLVYHLQMIDAIGNGDAEAAHQASESMFDQVLQHIPV
jgi:DNA-binding FadR family transcriptional regulator